VVVSARNIIGWSDFSNVNSFGQSVE